MGKLIKTEAGKRRIAAASERLDRTVAEMGQQHRADLPQGENAPAMGQNQPIETWCLTPITVNISKLGLQVEQTITGLT